MGYIDDQVVHYKKLIVNTESRVVYYKKLMGDIHRDVSLQIDWFKEHVRDALNFEQRLLKELREEYQWYKDGVEPPFKKPSE